MDSFIMYKIGRILIEMSRASCLASSVSLIFRRFNWTCVVAANSWSRTFPLYQAIKVGCAVFAFFICFEANLREYGYYSLHIRMYRYIRKHQLFASFASYSLQNMRKIRIQIFDLLQNKYIFSCWRIFSSKYMFWSEYSQNFKRFSHSSEYSIVNIRLQIFAYKRIFACKHSHTGKFSLFIYSNNKGKPFTILRLN